MTRPSRLVAGGGVLISAAVGAVLWRRWRFPVRHRRRDVDRLPDPPDVPTPDVPGRPAVQLEADGTGPRFHRRYRVRIGGAALTPEELMGQVAKRPDAFVPTETSRFEKTFGAPGPLTVGDEYEVHPTGPWHAPVRVAACDGRGFTLVTLDGHLEAGQIRFSAAPGSHGAGTLVFTIESWARSATPTVHVAYDVLGLAAKAQEATWTFFCERVAETCGGRRLGPVEVLTERESAAAPPEAPPEAPPAPEAAPGGQTVGRDVRRPRARRPVRRPIQEWERYKDRIEALRDAPFTVDLAQRHTFTAEGGWRTDHHRGELPPEPPGPPLPAGAPGASWAAACALVRAYAFPDPRLITGLFTPDGPVAGRPMLLRARFMGLSFWFGVRVDAEIDETVETDAGPARDWGYGYATLPGHFEKGHIAFRVRKEEATGRILFLMDAVSQIDHIPNPFFRVGFAIFGRHLQARFARTAISRMQALTAEAIAEPVSS
ncbi:MAG TPA: DUF1990 family protein [Rubricoccaceae bacterium]